MVPHRGGFNIGAMLMCGENLLRNTVTDNEKRCKSPKQSQTQTDMWLD
jgi:hypothetical protein